MRCKACNSIMEENEIIWIEELGMHEELCTHCKRIVAEAEVDASVEDVYGSDSWDGIVTLRSDGDDE